MKMGKASFSIQWHITSNCMNRCKHCYMYDKNYVPEDCSFDEFSYMFQNVKNFCEKYDYEISVSLTGGSPLMNKDFEKIAALLKRNGIWTVRIMDIPEMITEDSIKILKKYSINEVQLSLDGMENTHDEIRGEGSFQRTISAYKLLLKNGIIPRIMYTISKSNYEELIPLCKYLKTVLDSFIFAYDFVVCTGNASSENDFGVPIEKIEPIMEDYYQFALKENVNGNGKYRFGFKPTTYKVMHRNGNPIQLSSRYSVIEGCYIGWVSICILQNGDVLPCRRLPIVLGNLKHDSFENIFLQSDVLKKFRRYQLYQKECGSCEYGMICRGCPAVTYGLTGDYFEKFPYCFYYKESKNLNFEIPKMDTTNLEESEWISQTLQNRANINLADLITPSILRAYSVVKKYPIDRSLFIFDYPSWQKKYQIDLKEDERRLVELMLQRK